MNINWLPGKRYLLRELLPRAVLLTATFKLLLPLVPFGMFDFKGSLLAASAIGIAFTALFWLFGAQIMGSRAALNFMDRNKSRWWFLPANLLLVFTVPVLALFVTVKLAPSCFGIHGLTAYLAGSVILNLACALTHDWGSS